MPSKHASRITRRLLVLAALLLAGGLMPGAAAAVSCVEVLSALDFTSDTDADGFTDFQECSGISLASLAPVPSCLTPDASGALPERSTCLHPDSPDLFVVYALAENGLLAAGATAVPEPFKRVSAYGVTFDGLAALRVTVHQVEASQVSEDRTVTSLPASNPDDPLLSAQKAVRITEDLDRSGATLGYCQYGTPNGLDGCTVYSRRILDFINATCAGLAIVQADGKTASDATAAFRAYATHTILHEVGHAVGGLTAAFNSRYGGYHYGSGTMMEQYVVATTKGGKCKFAVSSQWNLSLDPPAVKLNQ